MAKTSTHVLIGAIVGALGSLLPDAMLATYRWGDWLPADHPLIRLHQFAHSKDGLICWALLGYAFHLLVDYWTHPPTWGLGNKDHD